jgi:glycosyltransferase involved in cell wall biosynthesis
LPHGFDAYLPIECLASSCPFRQALAKLKKVIGTERLFLTGCAGIFVEDPREKILETRILNFPLPKYYGDKPGRVRQSDGKLVISFLGQADLRKNSALIPRIVSRVLAEVDNVHFFIQCYSASKYRKALTHSICKQLEHNPQVSLSTVPLEFEEYQRRVKNSDLVVLPYNSQVYRIITSGVLADAAAFGVPCVVPGNTWCSSAVNQGWASGTVFNQDSVAEISDAIVESVNNIDELLTLASSRAARWAENHSVKAYLEKIELLTSAEMGIPH